MALKNSVAVLIQARLNSKRFPEKIIKKINNKTIIQLIYERLLFCKEINDIIVVTTKDKKDDKLATLKVVYDDELVGEYDLLAAKDVEKVNMFTRLIKSLNYLIWGDV